MKHKQKNEIENYVFNLKNKRKSSLYGFVWKFKGGAEKKGRSQKKKKKKKP